MRRYVTFGVHMEGKRWMLTLDCNHVVLVTCARRPSNRQSCRFCREDEARKRAKPREVMP